MSSNHLLQLTKPIIPDGELIKCEGVEGLSESFKFDLTFHILENDKQIKTDLIGRSVSFRIKKRSFNGMIWCYKRLNKNILKLTVVPWFHFFKLSSDCRIFRQQTVPDIFRQVCRKNNIYDFDLSALKDVYPIKNYIVQYNETDFDFLNRILNETGISYYFEHGLDCHLMKLCDRFLKTSSYPCVSSIKTWRRHLKEQPCCAEVIGYNYRNLQRFSAFSKKNDRLPYMKSYYLGGGLDKLDAQKIADQLFYSFQNQSDFVEGRSDEVNFSVAGQFKPEGIEDSTYFLTKVRHKVFENTQYNSEFSGAFYENHFTAVPIRPDFWKRRFSRSFSRRIVGIQSAKVAGPIDGGPSTDRMGRVTVRFFWEREKNTVCEAGYWIRVAQLWAGSGFGMQFLPRTGDEVLVGFRLGNPDDPIILGGFYNRENTLPYSQNQSGFKSGLIGKKTEKANALWVDDTPKRETFRIQAAQDFSTFVRQNEKTIVGRSCRLKISGKQSIQSQRRIIWASSEMISLSVGDVQIVLEPNVIQIKGTVVELN